MGDQFVFAECLAGVARQVFEERVLLAGQVDRGAGTSDGLRCLVDYEIGDLECVWLLRSARTRAVSSAMANGLTR